jgi:probable phosphoglycerate mutase
MNTFLLIIALLGGVVSIGTIIIWFKQRKAKIRKRVSWKGVEKGILKLRDQLIKDRYYPTLIIGIGRGGSIVGALLSGSLGNIPILVIDRIYNWKGHERTEGLFDSIKITKNIDRILLVAGELHSGNTARKYTEYFMQAGAGEVKMLTFMKEPFPTFKPDYFYLESTISDMRFPWMLTRDYKKESQIDYTK